MGVRLCPPRIVARHFPIDNCFDLIILDNDVGHVEIQMTQCIRLWTWKVFLQFLEFLLDDFRVFRLVYFSKASTDVVGHIFEPFFRVEA